MIRRALTNKFVQSGIVFAGSSFIVSIIHYLFNLIVARGFELSVYGEYVTALSYLMIFSVPFTAFSLVVIKKVGTCSEKNRPQLAHEIQIWLIEQIQARAPTILAISSVVILILYYVGNITFLSTLFIISSLAIALFTTFYDAVLQSYKSFLLSGGVMLTGAVAKLAGGFGIVYFASELVYLYGITLLSGLIIIYLGKKAIKMKESNGQEQQAKAIFSSFSHYAKRKSVIVPLLASIGLVGLINVDVILVKKFFSPDDAGLYAAVSLLGKIILYVAAPISLVAFSFFTGQETKENSKKILLFSTALFLLIGLSSATVYYLVPNLIVTIVFGERFLSISPLIYLAAIFGSLYSLTTLFTQYLIAQTSRASLLTLFAVVIQTILIYINHQQIENILIINIGITFLLCCLLSFFVFKKNTIDS